MSCLTFSIRRMDGSSSLHYGTAERAVVAAIQFAQDEPGAEFIVTAHPAVPHIVTSAQERGHLRAAALSPKERAAIARQGAFARAESLSPERRSEIARQASLARWRGQPEPDHDPEAA